MNYSHIELDIVVLLVGGFIVSSCLMWWFNTSLPIHMLGVLRFLGWKTDDSQFWSTEIDPDLPRVDLSRWTRVDFDEWVNDRSHVLGELLTCPGCLSFHIAFWVSFVMSSSLVLIDGYHPIRLCGFIAGWLAWPSIGNYVLKLIKTSK